MNGKEFIRRVSKLARKNHIPVHLNTERGKGGHQMIYYGDRRTVVKTGEIAKGLLHVMCKDLGIDPNQL